MYFNLISKYHYLGDIRFDLQFQLNGGVAWLLNPAIFATQMAEDYVGRTSVISRTTNQLTAPLRTAQKYLLEVKLRWTGARGSDMFIHASL